MNLVEQPAKYGGQLEGVPIEIVEFMLDNQEAQGNKRDASVFEKLLECDLVDGGFDLETSGVCDEMIDVSDGNYEPMLKYLKSRK